MNACKHQRHGSGIVSCRHAAEPCDPSAFSFDDAEPFAASIWKKNERDQRVCASVSFQSRAQVNISNDLSVDDHECLMFEELTRVVESSTGPKYQRLFNVMKLHAKLASIAKRSSHGFGAVMQINDDLIDA